jgi:cysteine desulfurase
MDYNATAPLLPVVGEKMRAIESLPLNPSSVHHYGRKAKQLTEQARRTVAEFISAWPDEVIFTASGTEANNMALLGLKDYRLAVAATEHSSILNIAKNREGALILPVDTDGMVKMDALDAALQHGGEKLLVSIMLANNETGVIQPVKEIARRVHQAGALIHCDAVQAVGKHQFDFSSLGVDMLTIAGHKIGAPIGVGALVVRNELMISPLLVGGGQEKGRRGGTENVAAIAGFGWTIDNLPDLSHLRQWRDDIEKQLLAVSGETIIAGQGAERLINTINLTMPGVESETQLMNFDLEGFCISAGSACSSGRIESSHVLAAMGYDKPQANSAIRISLGWNTQAQEVENFVQSWQKIFKRLGNKQAA